jgi:hypothetical protein
MKIHGFAAFIFLVMFGMVASTHISFNWQVKKNRRISGIMLVAIFSILILSGYMLYYCGGDFLRKYTSYFHWALGAGSCLLYIFHALSKTKRQNNSVKIVKSTKGSVKIEF